MPHRAATSAPSHGTTDEPPGPWSNAVRVPTIAVVSHHRRPPRCSHGADRGVTLVELLVVIVVLGVLSGIVAMGVRGSSEQSSETGCVVEQRAVLSAIEVYRAQHGTPPPRIEVLVPDFLTRLPGSTTATGGGSYDPVDGEFDATRC